MSKKQHPIIIALTGASGSIYGINILKTLKTLNIPTILVLSREAYITIKYELSITHKEIINLANTYYNNEDITAPIASGSFITSGMIVAPCSVKSLSAIANCYSNNLITRAADVTLKEKRKLAIMFRETPLHLGHIKLMEQATLNGAIIVPPVPSFYFKPESINDIVDHSVARVLDLFNIEHNVSKRWKEKADV